nr:S-layer homology domain-containing protein [bacterium]
MFTTLKYRRQVAVLAALAMVASVLVAAPAVAADPKPDFKATFDACVGGAAESAGFEDVPANHANAGDIDCIAYYGITRGTSATTYSPSMSVTREHMALFLTRLAGLVGIEITSTPADAGFADTGDLSAESQTAINQLADLGITRGTSATTYSPSDSVTRGQMGLFIARLMNLMAPLSDGFDNDGDWSYTPSDVVANDQGKTIGSPYTDLGSATKSAYDAITQLYELGVVSGISDTAYGPSALITRASMAEFMAAVLDHSNARPAGLAIQADKTSGYDDITEAVIVVSYRGDDFAPVAGQAVDLFRGTGAKGSLGDDGKCVTSGTNAATVIEGSAVCEQDANDATTDENGNYIFDGGTVNAGMTNVYYAWTGKSGAKFDADDVDEKTVSITAKLDTDTLHVTSTISENADNSDYSSTTAGRTSNASVEDADSTANEPRVDLDVTKSVTFTVQLRDTDGGDVARADQSISVRVVMGGSTNSANTHTVKTNSDGKITYTINAPTDSPDTGDNIADDRRLDTITFSMTGLANSVEQKILWLEDDPARTTAKATVSSPYSVISGGNARVTATVTIYDQYGNLYKVAGQQVEFTVPTGATAVARGAASGRASYTGTEGSPTPGTAVAWSATVVGSTLTVDTTNAGVTPVNVAPDDSRAPTDATVAGVTVAALYAKENKFRAGSADTPDNGSTLYSYDSDDVFLQNGVRVSMDKFEVLLGKNISGTPTTPAVVRVALYDDDGSSIFDVTTAAS